MTDEDDRARRDQYQLDCNLEKFKHGLTLVEIEHREVFGAVFTNGTTAARALFILNGGGVLALLTLLGHVLATRTNPGADVKALSDLAQSLADPILLLLLGATCAAVISGVAYLGQAFFSRDAWGDQGRQPKVKWARKAGNICQIAAVALFIVGIGLFVRAGFLARYAFDVL